MDTTTQPPLTIHDEPLKYNIYTKAGPFVYLVRLLKQVSNIREAGYKWPSLTSKSDCFDPKLNMTDRIRYATTEIEDYNLLRQNQAVYWEELEKKRGNANTNLLTQAMCSGLNADIANWLIDLYDGILIVTTNKELLAYVEEMKIWYIAANAADYLQARFCLEPIEVLEASQLQIASALVRAETSTEEEKLKLASRRITNTITSLKNTITCGGIISKFIAESLRRSTKEGVKYNDELWKSLDTSPDIIAIKDGLVIELRTGKLRERTKEDRFTKVLDRRLPNYTCPTEGHSWQHAKTIWQEFLNKFTLNDEYDQKYLQRRAGSMLSANVKDRIFSILYGSTGNGKSAFFAVIMAVLGPFCCRVAEDVFLTTGAKTTANAHTANLVPLKGARAAILPDIGNNLAFNEGNIKLFCSDLDYITVRGLYKQAVVQQVTWKCWMACNYIPAHTGTDGFSSKIEIYHCRAKFKVPGTDITVLKKEQELEGTKGYSTELVGNPYLLDVALEWMVEGAKIYYNDSNYDPPASVVQFTKNMLESETRPILYQRFLEENFEFGTGEEFKIRGGDFYLKFREWWRRDYGRLPTNADFVGAMLRDGRITKTGGGNKVAIYHGLKLKLLVS